MRHNKNFNHLSRKKAHRKALLSNMASSLILHKRIRTTVPKAKALKIYVEPLITKAKDKTDHAYRLAFKELKNKQAIQELFGVVREKVGDRPGGYTRILKTGYRLGDNAQMCIIELVDFNEEWLKDSAKKESKAPKKTRRSRRGGGGSKKSVDSTTDKNESVESAQASEQVDKVEDIKQAESTPKEDDANAKE